MPLAVFLSLEYKRARIVSLSFHQLKASILAGDLFQYRQRQDQQSVSRCSTDDCLLHPRLAHGSQEYQLLPPGNSNPGKERPALAALRPLQAVE